MPPDPGIADESSAQTMPSLIAIKTPTSHPSMHCGPPIVAMIRGMVINGPIPTMLDMFRAVACRSPNLRSR